MPFKADALLTAHDELELARRVTATRTAIWHRVLESDPLTTEAMQRLVESSRFARVAASKSLQEIRELDHDELVRWATREADPDSLVPIAMARASASAAAAKHTAALQAAVSDHLAARDRMVRCNLALVYHAVPRSMQRAAPDDAIADGLEGLLKAVVRFDPGYGLRFATYAVAWIRAIAQDGHRRRCGVVDVPRVVDLARTRWARIEARLGQSLGSEPSVDEVQAALWQEHAASAAHPPAAPRSRPPAVLPSLYAIVSAMRARTPYVPLDASGPSNDRMASGPCPEDDYAQALAIAALIEAVGEVTARVSDLEADALRTILRGEQLADVARRHGVSRQRVDQVRKRALRRVQAHLDAKRGATLH